VHLEYTGDQQLSASGSLREQRVTFRRPVCLQAVRTSGMHRTMEECLRQKDMRARTVDVAIPEGYSIGDGQGRRGDA